ncbi:FecR protein [Flaviramulus basaltis]|uniref:FecR protein n=1 Tax=Flaviramulus basaltis TaxID=369401 RepID=A0A1K2IIZ3_9FLAO|nr:FecR family protein [Flaviramulus basaltis]SFZ92262.1 FecR protein [Flaviramulus basaltis]
MISKKEQELIVKYLTKQASFLELDELSLWLENSSNEKEFINYLKINYAIDFNMKKFDSINSKKQLIELINKEKKIYKLRKVKKIAKYVAIAIFFLGIGYIYQNGYLFNKPNHIIKSESVTLQLENGNVEIINENGTSKVLDSEGNIVGSQNGTQLVYNNEVEKETLIYNTLNVPYGKRFKIQLSDGTIVHLNAGTSLKYPVKFLKGEKRKVFLIGEAFFNVAKDAKHPFIVDSDALDIQVLGTQFNVSSYPEDDVTDVVLVEGSVNLHLEKNSNTNDDIILKPGYKGSFIKEEDNISTKQVLTNIYTSWIYGELFFRNTTFENILKKLERHYNVTIINKNLKLSKEEFNASFREAPIEKILEYFKITYNINYTINENNITIY